MKKVFFFSFFVSLCCSLCAQVTRDSIKLDGTFGTKKSYEFSSLVQDAKMVYLIPGLKKNDDHAIYVIDKIALNAVLKTGGGKIISIDDSIGFVADNFKKFMSDLPDYDGVEATVINGDDIYFSVETGGDNCYIVKGKISGVSPNKIITLTNSIALPKPAAPAGITTRGNDGFESMVFYKDSLSAFFERKYDRAYTTVYRVDKNLANKVESKDAGVFKEGRLSDMTMSADGNSMYGITMTYDPSPAKDVYRVEQLKDNVFSDHILLGSGSPDFVWEGIIPYKDGFLLINDNNNVKNDTSVSQLLYVTPKAAPSTVSTTAAVISAQKTYTFKLIDLWNQSNNSSDTVIVEDEKFKLNQDSTGAADIVLKTIILQHGKDAPSVIPDFSKEYTSDGDPFIFNLNITSSDGKTKKDVKIVVTKKEKSKTADEKFKEQVLAKLEDIANAKNVTVPIGWFTLNTNKVALKTLTERKDEKGKTVRNFLRKVYDSTFVDSVTIKRMVITGENGCIRKKGIKIELSNGNIYRNERAPVSLYRYNRRTSDFILMHDTRSHAYLQLGDLFTYDYDGKFHYPDTFQVVLTKDHSVDSIYSKTSFNNVIDATVYSDLLALVGRKPAGIIQTQVQGNFILNASNLRNHDASIFSFIKPYFRLSKFDSKFSQVDTTIIDTAAHKLKNKMYIDQISYLQAGLELNLLRAGVGPNQNFLINIGADVNLTSADSLAHKDITHVHYYGEIKYTVNGPENFGMEASIRYIREEFSKNSPFDKVKGFWIFNPQVTIYYSPFNNPESKIYLRYANYAEIKGGKDNFGQFQFGFKTNLFNKK